MAPYRERFPIGTRVRVAGRGALERFQAEWCLHTLLTEPQLAHGGEVAEVRDVGFYRGADAVYRLDGLPGLWHEACLLEHHEAAG